MSVVGVRDSSERVAFAIEGAVGEVVEVQVLILEVLPAQEAEARIALTGAGVAREEVAAIPMTAELPALGTDLEIAVLNLCLDLLSVLLLSDFLAFVSLVIDIQAVDAVLDIALGTGGTHHGLSARGQEPHESSFVLAAFRIHAENKDLVYRFGSLCLASHIEEQIPLVVFLLDNFLDLGLTHH